MSNFSPRQTGAVLVALLLFWCVGLFGRVYWTPDEPREAALAASVSRHWAALPSLAGTHFAEKPPLTYWLAGASMDRFGHRGAAVNSAAAARLPQLAYALISFFAVLLLARQMMERTAAFTAAVLFATCELVYQVQIWLDTDALLLCGVTVALTGMYAGLRAGTRTARWRGYFFMHLGLTLAFFAKNFAAWLVPVLAFLTFIIWERRWRELLRWEVYLGALVPLACIAFWVHAVADLSDGQQSLRILFWNNLVGRVIPLAADTQMNYASGHPNAPGKYVFELFLDLFPWTLLVLYALKCSWHGARAPGPHRAAWRFALCAAVPGLVVLSCATTARSIYAVPCLIGFALLIALWLTTSSEEAVGTYPLRRLLTITAVLVAALALILLGMTLALQWTVERANIAVFSVSTLSLAAVLLWALRSRFGSGPPQHTLLPTHRVLQLATAWSVLCSLGALSLYSAMNRTQDFASLAQRVRETAATRPLLLWNADETTLAWAQLYLPLGHWSAMNASQGNAKPVASGASTVSQPHTVAQTNITAALKERLRAAPDTVVVSMIQGGGWSRARWLAYLRARPTESVLAPNAVLSQNPALIAAGLQIVDQVMRPGGRGYLLWSNK